MAPGLGPERRENRLSAAPSRGSLHFAFSGWSGRPDVADYRKKKSQCLGHAAGPRGDFIMSQSSGSPPQLKSRIGAILRSTSGNFLEQFDFFLFGFYAPYIAKAFFPSENETA